MSGERWGAKFAEEGKAVADNRDLVYSSELDQLKVSIVADPPHLYFLTPLKKMTNLVASSTAPVVSEELLKFKHNLPYTPSVWAYFNIVDAPAELALYIGRYTIDFVRLGATLIYAYADETYVYIKHDYYYTDVTPAVNPSNEVNADKFNMRVKLLVMNGRYAGQVFKDNP